MFVPLYRICSILKIFNKSTLQTVWYTGPEQSCFKIIVKHFADFKNLPFIQKLRKATEVFFLVIYISTRHNTAPEKEN